MTNQSFQTFASEPDKYISKFSGHETKPANYLAELMCERKAKKEKKVIQGKFWQHDEWKKFYAQQIVAANSLLKTYPPAVVLAAITKKEMLWSYSLRAPQLLPYLAEELRKLELSERLAKDKKEVESKPAEKIEALPTQEIRQQTNKKKNTFNKLKDL